MDWNSSQPGSPEPPFTNVVQHDCQDVAFTSSASAETHTLWTPEHNQVEEANPTCWGRGSERFDARPFAAPDNSMDCVLFQIPDSAQQVIGGNLHTSMPNALELGTHQQPCPPFVSADSFGTNSLAPKAPNLMIYPQPSSDGAPCPPQKRKDPIFGSAVPVPLALQDYSTRSVNQDPWSSLGYHPASASSLGFRNHTHLEGIPNLQLDLEIDPRTLRWDI